MYLQECRRSHGRNHRVSTIMVYMSFCYCYQTRFHYLVALFFFFLFSGLQTPHPLRILDIANMRMTPIIYIRRRRTRRSLTGCSTRRRRIRQGHSSIPRMTCRPRCRCRCRCRRVVTQGSRLSTAERLEQRASANGPHVPRPLGRNLSLQDLLHRDGSSVKRGVGVLALHDDGAVDLDAGIEPPRLDVREDGLEGAGTETPALRVLGRRPRVGLERTRGLGIGGCGLRVRSRGGLAVLVVSPALHGGAEIHGAPGTIGPGHDGQVAPEADAGVHEGGKGLPAVDDADAVVNVEADLEPSADGVHLDARGRAPRSIGQPRNQDAGARGARDLEASTESGEDGEADCFGNNLGRDGDNDAVLGLLLGRVNDAAARLVGFRIGRGWGLAGPGVSVDTFGCGNVRVSFGTGQVLLCVCTYCRKISGWRLTCRILCPGSRARSFGCRACAQGY